MQTFCVIRIISDLDVHLPESCGGEKKKETRLTAGISKSRPKHVKVKKKATINIRTRQNLQIDVEIPFGKLQNDTKTTTERPNTMKN